MKDLDKFESEDILYHYTKTSTALEYILAEEQLRLSGRSNSNDPIENLTHATTIKKVYGGFDLSKSVHHLKVFKDIDEQMRRLKQVCFCKNDMSGHFKKMKDKPYEFYGCMKPRMWEQYADNYKGVCLIFSKSELEKQLNDTYEHGDIEYVSYSDLNEKNNIIDSRELSESNYEKCLTQVLKKTNKFIFHKHQDYSGENEYRICSYLDEVPYVNIESAIKGIIVSTKNSKYFKEQLCAYGVNLGIDVLRVDWKNNGIEVVDLIAKFEAMKRDQAFASKNNIKIVVGFKYL